METKFIDPTPDRKLLDHNFDGYKLGVYDTLVATVQLVNPPLKVVPKTVSFLHARIFGLHNYLVGESTDTHENIYYIDKNRNVRKAKYDKVIKTIEFCKLWTFPDSEKVSNSDSNIYIPSLKLVSENLAIASDGLKTFYLLETGKRSSGIQWKILHSEELLQGKGFFIQDAVLKGQELHVLLCSIETGGKRSSLAVHWISLINESNIWRQKSLKELCVQGDSGYIYLERSCEAIYVASTISCKFVFDSENIIMETSDEQREQISKLNFKWSQDSNFVAIHFIMPHEIQKEDVKVNCLSSHITVEYKNSRLLDGALYSTVHTHLTTISVSKNLLEVTLAKTDGEDEWSSLLRDYDTKKQYVGGLYERTVRKKKGDKTVSHETVLRFSKESVEECDYANSEHTILERLCAKTHKVTHRCSLGTGPILLTMEANNTHPPRFGVRYDVDIIVWEPRFENNEFELKHTATLLALGHIQATTENRKFLCSPSNLEYAVLCDMNSYIFLYRQNTTIESGRLINRKTGTEVKNAEHEVFKLPDEEILGLYAVPFGLYVLGETYIHYYFQI